MFDFSIGDIGVIIHAFVVDKYSCNKLLMCRPETRHTHFTLYIKPSLNLNLMPIRSSFWNTPNKFNVYETIGCGTSKNIKN